jgi:hypothetical protein
MTNSRQSIAAAMSLLFTALPCTAADFFLKNGDKEQSSTSG